MQCRVIRRVIDLHFHRDFRRSLPLSSFRTCQPLCASINLPGFPAIVIQSVTFQLSISIPFFAAINSNSMIRSFYSRSYSESSGNSPPQRQTIAFSYSWTTKVRKKRLFPMIVEVFNPEKWRKCAISQLKTAILLFSCGYRTFLNNVFARLVRTQH